MKICFTESAELAEDADGTDWELLRSMTDEEAEARAALDPDARPTDAAFWLSAKVSVPAGKTNFSHD